MTSAVHLLSVRLFAAVSTLSRESLTQHWSGCCWKTKITAVETVILCPVCQSVNINLFCVHLCTNQFLPILCYITLSFLLYKLKYKLQLKIGHVILGKLSPTKTQPKRYHITYNRIYWNARLHHCIKRETGITHGVLLRGTDLNQT